MAKQQAYEAVSSLLNLMRSGTLTVQLEALDKHLAYAVGAESEAAPLRAELAKLKTEIDATKAQTTFATKEYDVKTASARTAYDAFNAQIQKQSADKQAYIDALTKQAEALETKVEQAKRLLTEKLAECQASAARKQRELEGIYAARLVQLDMQEKDAQDRVDAAKDKLNTLIKSLGAA